MLRDVVRFAVTPWVRLGFVAAPCLAAALVVTSGVSAIQPPGCSGPPVIRPESQPGAVRAWFEGRKLKVLTFLGYSGAGYENEKAMLDHAGRILDEFSPATTLVNIGATPDGIGAVYALARRKGFPTSGIVSTQARDTGANLSPCVDVVFFVEDATWGGFVDGKRLSPTSQAIIDVSDHVRAIGGGEVARDELIAARTSGKARRDVRFIPAAMNHAIAIERAKKRGQPVPTDFSGAAATAMPPSKR
jgi:hypothetical protein